ncbi:MAG: PD-(D/E)XK nuclease domain-containing protein, partial [Bacteroidales bacterium]|nr:PD-(D/E)XK nuclease domain-containing protein [Bacteroidales bacterium]
DTTYVFELKVDGTAEEALAQIDTKDYAIAFQSDSRKVVKVGVKFDVATRTPEQWVIK